MAKVVILESSRRQADTPKATLDGRVWATLCECGRLHGYGVTDEGSLAAVDARLFADALRRGLAQLDERVGREAHNLISLLTSGGVVITRREKT